MALSTIRQFELAENPLKDQILNAADRTSVFLIVIIIFIFHFSDPEITRMGILIARDDIFVDLLGTALEVRQNTAANLFGRQIRCKDVCGRYHDFTITDYKTMTLS